MTKIQTYNLCASRYYVEYTECDLASTVRTGINFLKNLEVDVIIGPPCSEAIRTMATLATLYKKPVLGWGFVSQADLSDMTRFPYLITVLPTSQTWVENVLKMFQNL